MIDPAGTPEPKVEGSPAPTPPVAKDDSAQVTVSAQFKEEALKWKGKAEEFNRLEQELKDRDAQLADLTRRAYGGGQEATDPRAVLVAQLREQAQFDPVAQATLLNMEDAAVAKAENWLNGELLKVPEAKRDNVAKMIRNAGYQMGASYALNVLTDPETKTLAQQLSDTKAEVERLKGAKAHGMSPATTVPANANEEDRPNPESIPRAEYLSVISRGAQKGASEDDREKARILMRAVAKNKTRLED